MWQKPDAYFMHRFFSNLMVIENIHYGGMIVFQKIVVGAADLHGSEMGFDLDGDLLIQDGVDLLAVLVR